MKKLIIIGLSAALAVGGTVWASGLKCSFCDGTGFQKGSNVNCIGCKGTGRNLDY